MMSNYQNKASWPAMFEHRLTGLTHWNDARGFGFLKRDDARPDLFVHLNKVEELAIGQRVKFTVGTNSRSGKPEAQNVKLIEA